MKALANRVSVFATLLSPTGGCVFAAVLALTAGCGGDSEGARKITPHGVRYLDLKEGEGEPAKLGDGMHFAYTAYLADGKQFQHMPADKPATMRLGWCQPLIGLDEGLEGMKAGGKRKIWVPAYLAYGTRGSPPLVPPNSDLVFDVDLIRIVTPEQAKNYNDDVKKVMSDAEKQAIDNMRAEQLKPATGKDIPEAERKEITGPSGLKYVDFCTGDGREAVPGTHLYVLYAGYLSDGKRFDSKLNRLDPHIFVLGAGEVIEGWEVGLVGMRAGGKRKLIIPPALGYGNKRVSEKIPPNSTLIFDIELLRVR
jgi:FKBP-type peptidyl-prolyl cis-trans isomerase